MINDTPTALNLHGEQGWRSGENTCLPPMWSEFKSRRRRHMWVEFDVGSLPCSERFFSGYSGFLLSSKTNVSKFQVDQESGRRRTTMWMYYLQIVIYLFKLDFIVSVLKIDFMLVITLVISLADRSKGQKSTIVYKIKDCEEFELHIPSLPGTELEVNIDRCKKFTINNSRTADSEKSIKFNKRFSETSWVLNILWHRFYYVRDKGKLWCC